MHNTTELLTAAQGLLDTFASGDHSFYDWRNRLEAEVERLRALPRTMTRDQAFELLEVHFGPRASLSIQENAMRYFLRTDDKRDDEKVTWVVYVNDRCSPMAFTRDTLTEAVAAAVSSVEAYKEQA